MTKSRPTHLLTALAVPLLVTMLGAGTVGPEHLTATIEVTEVLTPTATPQVLTAVLHGTGRGRPFGRLTFDATERIDFRQFGDPAFPHPRTVVTDGAFTITTAWGDTLTGVYDGVGTADPDRPGFVAGRALAVLTGGTGRFRCASGFAPFTIDINTGALTEVVTLDTTVELFCSGHGHDR
jgi:hypothetical protein